MTIGLTLGIGPFISIFIGLYAGHLSDLIGRREILVGAFLLWALTFLGFAFAQELWQFAILNGLNGLCGSSFNPVSSALISDLSKPEDRKRIFYLRYFAINLGATFGPVVGAWLLVFGPSIGFCVTAIFNFLFFLVFYRLLPKQLRSPGSAEAPPFREILGVVASDIPLRFFTLAFVVTGLTYSQLESTLPQYLESILSDEGIRLFGVVSSVNALTVVVTQIPLTRLTSGLKLHTTIQLGTAIYGVGFLLFGILEPTWNSMIFSMVVLTLGEVLTFSNGNLMIDQIAPEDKKGLYFGVSNFWSMGATFGPALGGWLFQRGGGPFLFLALGVIGLSNILFYYLGSRAQLRKAMA